MLEWLIYMYANDESAETSPEETEIKAACLTYQLCLSQLL